VQKIFLQVNIGDEVSKSGTEKEAAAALAHEIHALENVSLQGLMCMPPYFDDPERARPYFQELFQIREKIQADLPGLNLKHLSMGMSNDFKVAIQEGATLVRVGTAIFGSRN
jgi:hypothetical protein